MLKNMFGFVVICVAVLCCEGTVVKIPNNQLTLEELESLLLENEPEQWQDHVMDFLNLVDYDTVLSTVVRFVDDPEVMKFINFLLSSKFKDMVRDFESLDEFKEAYIFLATKGYDVKEVIDYVNKVLSIPEFDKPERVLREAGYNTGVSGLIAAIVGKLPLEEMRDLLKSKVENYHEVARFIEVIESPEFKDIMQRMLGSQKFAELKSTFESYGVDFNFICIIINEVIGNEYESVICSNKKEINL